MAEISIMVNASWFSTGACRSLVLPPCSYNHESRTLYFSITVLIMESWLS